MAAFIPFIENSFCIFFHALDYNSNHIDLRILLTKMCIFRLEYDMAGKNDGSEKDIALFRSNNLSIAYCLWQIFIAVSYVNRKYRLLN